MLRAAENRRPARAVDGQEYRRHATAHWRMGVGRTFQNHRDLCLDDAVVENRADGTGCRTNKNALFADENFPRNKLYRDEALRCSDTVGMAASAERPLRGACSRVTSNGSKLAGRTGHNDRSLLLMDETHRRHWHRANGSR